MSPWIIAVLTPLLLFAAGVGAKEQAKPPESAERMVFGAVYRGSVYTAETTQAFAKGDFAEGGVTASSIELNREMPWIDFPARWKIGDGSLIVIFDEYKQFGLIGIRQRNFSQGTCDLRKLSERAKKEDHARYELVYNFIFGPWGGPGHMVIGTVYERMRNFVNYRDNVKDDEYPFSHYEFFFDFVLFKSGDGPQFVLASEALQLKTNDDYKEWARKTSPKDANEKPRDADRVYWGSAKDPLKPMLGVWRYDEDQQWTLADKIKDPCFNERFHAFVKGTTYFFLTDSGKVYVSKKPDKGERKLEALWDNDHYPITAAVADADTDKVFLFGKARKGDMLDKDFYWELDETVRRVDYDPSAVKTVKTVEPLKTVIELARFLADEKQIMLPNKADKDKDK